MRRPLSTLLLAALASGCGSGPAFELAIRVRQGDNQNALAAADSAVLRVHYPEGDGYRCHELPLDGLDGDRPVPGIEPGAEAILELRAYNGTDVVALGRTPPLILGADTEPAGIFVASPDSLARVTADRALDRARAFAEAVALPDDRVMVVGGGDGLRNGRTYGEIEVIGLDPEWPLSGELLTDEPLERIGHGLVYVPEDAESDAAGQVLSIAGTFGSGIDTLDANGWNNGQASFARIDPISGELTVDAGEWEIPMMGFETVVTEDGYVAGIGGFGEDPGLGWLDETFYLDLETLEPRRGPSWGSNGPGEQGEVSWFQEDGRDRFLIAGGFQGTSLQRAWVWNGERDDAPEQVGDLETARLRHQISDLGGGFLLVSGGSNIASPDAEVDHGTSLASLELYDVDDESFTRLPASLVTARQRHVALPIAGQRVLMCGGWGGTTADPVYDLDDCEVYDHTSRQVSPFPWTIGPGGAGIATAPLSGGRWLLMGGVDDPGEPHAEIYLYTPPEWQDALGSSNCSR